MPPTITAKPDPKLTARIVSRTPLLYRDGPDEQMERPAYVRAGSSLAPVLDYVAVVQDNANFIALIDLRTQQAECIPLPAGPDGHRVFDRDHDNKDAKLDLEACLSRSDNGEQMLVAFGSGSTPTRQRIVIVRWRDDEPQVQVIDGTRWYAALREATEFAGSELNLEGAIALDIDRIRLFQRGNGEPRGDLQPVNATADLSWRALWQHLQKPDHVPPPPLENIVQYELGALEGVRLSFSDAELVGDVVLFSASAEGSGNAAEDGEIVGSVLGVIDADGARWVRLTDEDGSPFAEKIEGLSVAGDDPREAFFVVDDDHDQPSELFEVRLDGPWFDRVRADSAPAPAKSPR
jgi:hypothetical protein